MTALRRLVLLLLLVAPAAIALDFVHRFGVDVPFWDEWEFIPIYQLLYTHQLRFADLFALHNEHRIFFPRLLMLALGNAFDGSTVSWMYASVAILAAAGVVLFVQHRKLHAGWASFVPIAWILFTLRQAQNLVWGWQVQIILCVAALIAAVAVLREGSWGRFLLAAGLAFVSSFSFAAGLLAWPSLLVLLLGRRLRERIPWSMPALWALLSAGAWALYFHGYVRPAHRPASSYPLEHPLRTLYAAVGTLGGCISADVRGAAAAGGVLLLLFALLAYAAAEKAIDWRQAMPAVPLLLFAAGGAAMVAFGRVGFGYQGVSNASRYATVTLLGVIGLYQGLLALRESPLRQRALGVFAVLLLLSLFGSWDGAIAHGEEWRAQRLHDVEVLRDLPRRRDEELKTLFARPEAVRERAVILARYKLSALSE